jgi:hypothetical protein
VRCVRANHAGPRCGYRNRIHAGVDVHVRWCEVSNSDYLKRFAETSVKDDIGGGQFSCRTLRRPHDLKQLVNRFNRVLSGKCNNLSNAFRSATFARRRQAMPIRGTACPC